MATFTYERDEFIRHSMWPHLKPYRDKRGLLLVAIAIVLVIGALAWAQRPVPLTWIGIFVFGVYLLSLLFLKVWRNFRDYHKQLRLGDREIVVEFTKEGVSTTFDLGSFKLPWGQIVKWDLSPECLYLYYTDWTPQLVPRRALSPVECELAMTQLNDIPRATDL